MTNQTRLTYGQAACDAFDYFLRKFYNEKTRPLYGGKMELLAVLWAVLIRPIVTPLIDRFALEIGPDTGVTNPELILPLFHLRMTIGLMGFMTFSMLVTSSCRVFGLINERKINADGIEIPFYVLESNSEYMWSQFITKYTSWAVTCAPIIEKYAADYPDFDLPAFKKLVDGIKKV